jgi:cytochrome c oxidase subunit II
MSAMGRVSRLVVSSFLALPAWIQAAPQTVLQPEGPAAAKIAWLWWVLFWICTVILLIVVAFLIAALLKKGRGDRESEPPLGRTGFVIAGGIVLPAVVLVPLLLVSIDVKLELRSADTRVTVKMTGHQWWWHVEYPQYDIVSANEIYIPAGEAVRIELTAADVIHSFWVPNLHGKMDMMPGKTTVIFLEADRPGEFRGQCAEFCGLQHALMAFVVVALPPEEFDAWVEARQAPHPEPDDPELIRGRQVFFDAACHTCHAIRGTEADGTAGPDLTHIGSRLTVGAGTLPMNRAHLSGWVANPQPLKPGNLMPATYLDAENFQALIAYLESLE